MFRRFSPVFSQNWFIGLRVLRENLHTNTYIWGQERLLSCRFSYQSIHLCSRVHFCAWVSISGQIWPTNWTWHSNDLTASLLIHVWNHIWNLQIHLLSIVSIFLWTSLSIQLQPFSRMIKKKHPTTHPVWTPTLHQVQADSEPFNKALELLLAAGESAESASSPPPRPSKTGNMVSCEWCGQAFQKGAFCGSCGCLDMASGRNFGMGDFAL